MVRRLHSQLKTELIQKAFPGELVQTVRVECARTSGSTKFKINQEERQHEHRSVGSLCIFGKLIALVSSSITQHQIEIKLHKEL